MLGKPVPDFSLPRTGGRTFRLSEQRGKTLALYFYPKRLGCEIYAVSRDSPFELLSDAEKQACTQSGVIKDRTCTEKRSAASSAAPSSSMRRGSSRANGAE